MSRNETFKAQQKEAVIAAKKAIDIDSWGALSVELEKQAEHEHTEHHASEDRFTQVAFDADGWKHVERHDETIVTTSRLLGKNDVDALLKYAAINGKSECTQMLLNAEINIILHSKEEMEKRVKHVSVFLKRLEESVPDEHKKAWEISIAPLQNQLNTYFQRAITDVSKKDAKKLGEILMAGETCLSEENRRALSNTVLDVLEKARESTDTLKAVKTNLTQLLETITSKEDAFRHQIIKTLVEKIEAQIKALNIAPGKTDEAKKSIIEAINEAATRNDQKSNFLERTPPPSKTSLRIALGEALSTVNPVIDRSFGDGSSSKFKSGQ